MKYLELSLIYVVTVNHVIKCLSVYISRQKMDPVQALTKLSYWRRAKLHISLITVFITFMHCVKEGNVPILGIKTERME